MDLRTQSDIFEEADLNVVYQKLASALAAGLEECSLVSEGMISSTLKAYEKGVSRSTGYRQRKRNGIPDRDFTGVTAGPNENGSFVSRLERECREERDRQVVRGADAQYE